MASKSDTVSLRKALITKDDPLHVHKTLGTLCLASFVWRLSQWGDESDMAFQTRPGLTLPTILLHLSLNMSSFEFVLPPRRINSGYRIWPEYRAHSLVFLLRSLAFLTLNWYEQVNNISPNYYWNLVIVMGSMAGADLGSKLCGDEYKSGFSRQLVSVESTECRMETFRSG
jgi:hypothetical protein